MKIGILENGKEIFMFLQRIKYLRENFRLYLLNDIEYVFIDFKVSGEFFLDWFFIYLYIVNCVLCEIYVK